MKMKQADEEWKIFAVSRQVNVPETTAVVARVTTRFPLKFPIVMHYEHNAQKLPVKEKRKIMLIITTKRH